MKRKPTSPPSLTGRKCKFSDAYFYSYKILPLKAKRKLDNLNNVIKESTLFMGSG